MLIRHSAIYLFGRIIPAIIAFGLVALYTRLLPPDAYGLYAFVTAGATLAFTLSSMWLCTAAIRLYGRSQTRPELLGSLVIGLLAALGLVGLVAGGLAATLESARERQLVGLGFVLCAFMAWYELNADLLTARLRAGEYVLHGVLRAVIGGAVGASLAWFGWGAEGLLIGLIIGLAVPALIMTARQWGGLSLGPGHRVMLGEVLKFGVPLSLSYAIGSIVLVTDRFVISAVGGATLLGLYAVGFELADRIIKSLTTPIGTAALPLLIERFERDGVTGATAQAQQNLVILAGILFPATLGLIAVTPELVALVVGPLYREMSLAIVPLIALAALLSGLRSHYFDYAFHLGLKTTRHVVVVALIAVVNLILNLLLVPRMGAPGAAYATVAAYAVGLVASIAIGRKVFYLPIMPGTLAKIGVAALVMMGAVSFVPVPGAVAGLAIKVVLGIAVYGALVVVLDIDQARERLGARLSTSTAKADRSQQSIGG